MRACVWDGKEWGRGEERMQCKGDFQASNLDLTSKWLHCRGTHQQHWRFLEGRPCTPLAALAAVAAPVVGTRCPRPQAWHGHHHLPLTPPPRWNHLQAPPQAWHPHQPLTLTPPPLGNRPQVTRCFSLAAPVAPVASAAEGCCPRHQAWHPHPLRLTGAKTSKQPQ